MSDFITAVSLLSHDRCPVWWPDGITGARAVLIIPNRDMLGRVVEVGLVNGFTFAPAEVAPVVSAQYPQSIYVEVRRP